MGRLDRGLARLGLQDFPSAVLEDLLARARAVHPQSPLELIGHWFETKPPFADWFDDCEQLTLAANASQTPIAGFQIPNGCYGVLRFFANQCAQQADYASVTFAILIDNAPMAGYDSIKGPKSPSLQAPEPMMDALLPGQLVLVVASNSTAASITGVSARVRGWWWPASGTPGG